MPGTQAVKPDRSDIRDQPAYGLTEAARYLRLPRATLRTWLVGRAYPRAGEQATFQPLIAPANRQPIQLSFYNLIEAHVLRALRTEHGVSLAALRKAIAYAESALGLDRLLLSNPTPRAGQVSWKKRRIYGLQGERQRRDDRHVIGASPRR